mgnify:CR=1 FL=1
MDFEHRDFVTRNCEEINQFLDMDRGKVPSRVKGVNFDGHFFPPSYWIWTNKDCLIYMRTSTLTNVKVTRLRDRNPQSWNGSNPMDTPSELNIGMLSLVPKTPWIDLSSWEWFLILKEWGFEFWSSLISLVYPETSLFRSQPLDFWVPEGIYWWVQRPLSHSLRILQPQISFGKF